MFLKNGNKGMRYTVKNEVCAYSHLKVLYRLPNNTYEVFNYTSTCLVFDDPHMGHLDTPLGVKHNSPE